MGTKLRIVNVLVVFVMLFTAFYGPLLQPVQASTSASTVVISQVFGGNGVGYTHDYVELFNRSTSAVNLSGYSVQYASATGTGLFSANLTVLPSFDLQPGQYFLVQFGTGTISPAPDATNDKINTSGTNGKVALVHSADGLACNGGGTPCDDAQKALIADLVGYGSANFFEGTTAAPAATSSLALFRADSGCTDSDQNSADFATGAPAPRNSASPTHSCVPAPTVASTTPAKDATGVAVDANVAITFSEAVNLADANWYTLSCATSGAHTAVVSGSGASYTLNPDVDFSTNEVCTATVLASKVTSVATSTAMAADYPFSFTTGAKPPTVASTTPAGGASDVPLASTFQITFSESVAVTAPWYTFTCNGSPVSAAATPAGPADVYTLTPAANLPEANTCTVTLTPDNIASSTSGLKLTGTSTWSFKTYSADGCPVPSATYPVQASIGSVQGPGLVAAKLGNLTIKGVITNRTPNGATNQYGFYIQDGGDGDPLTSDGMFVYTASDNQQGTTLAIGTPVMVSGKVSEFSNGTQIAPAASGVVACGNAITVNPVTVNLPDDSDPTNLLERFENMLVHMPQTFIVDQNYFQGRYGQLTLSPGERLFTPTNGSLPGTVEAQIAALKQRMIVLDDNNYAQNPTVTPYLSLGTYPYTTNIFDPVRAGDLIAGGAAPEQGLTGILDQGPTNSSAGPYSPWYRIQPTVWPTLSRGANPRTAGPTNPGGNVKVAGFNLLNYFTTPDKAPERSTPPYNGGTNTPRGADSLDEFARQKAKTVKAIIGLGADVTGMIELENNGETAIADLVAALNAATAPGTYDYVRDNLPTANQLLPDGVTTADFIKATIVYKPAVVTPEGASVWSPNPIFDRQPLAQTFKVNASGEKFTVVVNHFKSKGSCPATGDVDTGQGCWNLRRVAQATELLNFINTTLVPVTPNVVAVGDYNAYGAEDPINTLTAGGLVNELLRMPYADRYTYVFDGAAGYLDHMLLTPSLDSKVAGVSIWHVNADESSLIDYNVEYKTTGTYPPDPYDGTVPYRASDHDPVIIGLNLNATPEVANPIPPIQSVYWGNPWDFAFAENTFSDANLPTDALTYSATRANGSALPAWLTFTPATRSFSGTPAVGDTGPLAIKVTATDRSGAKASSTFTLYVLDHIPTLDHPIADQWTWVKRPFQFTFAADAFGDSDLPKGDALTYAAMLENNTPLPSWLKFNPATRTLSGTPTTTGPVRVRIAATDKAGYSTSVVIVITVQSEVRTLLPLVIR